MLKYHYIAVTGSATENLANALSGLGERDRKIHKFIIAWYGSSGGVTRDLRFRVYLEQNRLVDYALNAWINVDTTNDEDLIEVPVEIPVDMDIKAGEGLQVGQFTTSATNAAFAVTMVYEDK